MCSSILYIYNHLLKDLSINFQDILKHNSLFLLYCDYNDFLQFSSCKKIVDIVLNQDKGRLPSLNNKSLVY